MLEAPPTRTLTRDDIATIRAWSSLPIVLKGILTAEDARLAVEHGADAIVVSNHGARQLDRVPAPADVTAEVSAAVDGRAEVWVDGGVRVDWTLAIALALGARGVLIGRPILWALAAAGQRASSRPWPFCAKGGSRSCSPCWARQRLPTSPEQACWRPGIPGGVTADRLPVDEALVAAATTDLSADAAAARHAELATIIDRANRLYYQEDAPELADAEYDARFRELVALETAHPDLIVRFSADAAGRRSSATFDEVRHRRPMLSLGNAFSHDELRAFDARVRRGPRAGRRAGAGAGPALCRGAQDRRPGDHPALRARPLRPGARRAATGRPARTSPRTSGRSPRSRPG